MSSSLTEDTVIMSSTATTPTNSTTHPASETETNVGRQESCVEHGVRDSPHTSTSLDDMWAERLAQERMDQIAMTDNELSRLKKRVLKVNQSCVKNVQAEIATAKSMNTMYARRIALLLGIKEKLSRKGLTDPKKRTQETTKKTTTPLSSRVSLKDVYESMAACTVCMLDRTGRDTVYMDSCTHTFCKLCVTRSRPQNRCMECRAKLNAFYVIVKEGERYRLKHCPMNYDFIADRSLNRDRKMVFKKVLTVLDSDIPDDSIPAGSSEATSSDQKFDIEVALYKSGSRPMSAGWTPFNMQIYVYKTSLPPPPATNIPLQPPTTPNADPMIVDLTVL